ncbi:MAG: outer membrane beta-barrel domain-containing protein [Deltaproteobacteria bacterium]|nr:outer membrane beta-barrel domain-containing protein [Deltaproteobacteria bacterium]
MMKQTILLVAGLLAVDAFSPSDAYAERRYNSLRTDPAVRHRRLLVSGRFEFAPLFESTINADFRHVIGGGAKLEYHLGDMLSIGVIGVYGTSIDTGLVKKIVPTLETSTINETREPSRDEFTGRLNSMPIHGAAYVSLTPWYGKLAAFSQAYVAFDFYFQAGVAFAQLKSDCPSNICNDTMDPEAAPDNNPNNDKPLNSGSRLGLYLGFGMHVFLNDFVALDLTVRDYAFSDNPSGADFNANLAVTSDDSRFLHHLFFGAGVSIMFPTTVKRTP